MVAAATREAVLAAVEEVGFVPNRAARRLVSGRSDAIGVLVPDITNPYFGAMVQAIQGDARRDGLAVLIADTGADPAEERRALQALSRQVDGLVAVTPITDLAAATVPVVAVNRQLRNHASVVVDQDAIAHLALGHLVDLGHRRIAVVRGPAAYWSAMRRDRAVERFAAGAEGCRIDLIGPAPATFEGGRTAYGAVDSSGASAVVAFNDLQATGLLVAAGEAGREVPSSLTVVGSDGLGLAAMTAPPLTTVAAPLEELGRTSRQLLGELLQDASGARRVTLSPRLVVRRTSAAPVVITRKTRHHRGRTHHVPRS